MRDAASRWLGVGLAGVLAIIVVSLWASGRLSLYISPDNAWFAVGMAMVMVVAAVWSFLTPLGQEREHSHGDEVVLAEDHDHDPPDHDHSHHGDDRFVARLAVWTGGAVASAAVVASVVLPPASLSTELAMARDTGAPPLFGSVDAIVLSSTADTSSFGVGQWATALATTTSTERFEGDRVVLEGFVTPRGDEADAFHLTRMVVTHCVIDAQTATVPVLEDAWASGIDVGQWVRVEGVIASDADGLGIRPLAIEQIDEPEDPYEY